jgi:hypothetical protein
MPGRYLTPYNGEFVNGRIGEQRSAFCAMAVPPVPALIGHAKDGITWLCPTCDSKIAVNVHPRQLVDIGFFCAPCMKASFTPGRQEGQPPAGRPVIISPGMSGITSSIDVGNIPIMMMSQRALDDYIRETGARAYMSGGETWSSGSFDDKDYLLRLADEVEQLLGVKYSALHDSDRRGQASATPPPRRHRLIELIEYARKAADLAGPGNSDNEKELDYGQLSELLATAALFRRWRQHPAWGHLVTSLTGDTEAQHSVMLLAVASYLTDTGNPIGIVFRQGGGKIPDMWVEPVLDTRLNIEIKTPVHFRAPKERPTVDSMCETIARLVNRYASSRRGQLAPEHSGVLAIGAFHLGQGAFDELCAAGQRVLSRQKNRKHHLAGLLFSEISYVIADVADAAGRPQRQITASLQTRLVRHPGYTGRLIVREGTPPWDNWANP